jgi:ABC-type antimicrobial peptide transport system permease subunit
MLTYEYWLVGIAIGLFFGSGVLTIIAESRDWNTIRKGLSLGITFLSLVLVVLIFRFVFGS